MNNEILEFLFLEAQYKNHLARRAGLLEAMAKDPADLRIKAELNTVTGNINTIATVMERIAERHLPGILGKYGFKLFEL